ncbi:MAG: hypothetical protein M1822_008572 [Bathelium mastoideum]|nr:MAG: hypothetical protein M1822_008572 [Bathelium mastoideum]
MASAFSVRPPTPPKATDEVERGIADALEFLENDLPAASAHPQITQSRPLDTPPTSSPLPSQQRKPASKKVCFSPWTDSHRLLHHTADDHGLTPLKPLPPSRELKSYRSILKQSLATPLPPSPDSARSSTSPSTRHSFPDFESILERMLHQLKHGDNKSKLGAYTSLSDILEAWHCLPDGPDVRTLSGRIADLTGYIRRDCLVTVKEDVTAEKRLVMQSLRLLSILLFTPTVSKSVKDDVRIFVLDTSITVLREARPPKEVTRQYISFLSQQNFATNIVSRVRAERLLDALQDIEKRVQGRSIVVGRLLIYQKLLSQVPSAVQSKINGVLEHVFHGMLSSTEDIRKYAISLGTQLGIALGKNKQSLRTVDRLFDTAMAPDGGSDYGSFCASRLIKMLEKQEHHKCVPQIWAVVILFFQGRGHKLPKWRHARSWIRIIQSCLNCSDGNVRFQAYFAWNRLISVVRPDTSTTNDMVNMLIQPLSLQLQRTEKSKASRQIKHYALSSYCNLLYYSLRPSASSEQLDHFWSAYVTNQLSDLLKQSPEYNHKANQILLAFFGGVDQIPWNEDRAYNPERLKPSELPRLSVKWLRRKVSDILPLMEQGLEIDFRDTASIEKMPGFHIWKYLMIALAEAGSQEVKASSELQEAIAHIVNSLYRLWDRINSPCGHGDLPSTSPVALFSKLACLSMEKLGPFHFTQKILVQKPTSNFVVVPSPSHRSYRTAKKTESPFQSTFRLIVTCCSSELCPANARQGLSELIEAACASQKTRQAQLTLLEELMAILGGMETQGRETIFTCVWSVIANRTIDTMECSQTTRSRPDQHLGHEFQTALKILVASINCNAEPFTIGRRLFVCLLEAIRRQVGHAGVALIAINPLSKIINEWGANMRNEYVLFWSSLILKQSPTLQDRQSFELGYQALWDSPLPSQPDQAHETLQEICSLVEKSLHRYLQSDSFRLKSDFLYSLAAFINLTPPAFKVDVLEKIQNGVVSVIEDAGKVCGSAEDFPQSVVELGRSIHNAFAALPSHNQMLLKQLAALVSADFPGSHCHVVGTMPYASNDMLKEEKAVHPEQVGLDSRQLSSQNSVDHPAIQSDSNNDASTNQVPACGLADLHEHSCVVEAASSDCEKHPQPQTSPQVATTSHQDQAPTPPSRSLPSPSRPTPKARLRHDDSQIEFTLFESSPTDFNAMESQLLTEHQKEVRMQQEAGAAAMFPDFQTTPGPKTINHLRHEMSGLALQMDNAGADEPATPTSSDHELLDDFPSSSPTPGSAAKHEFMMHEHTTSSREQSADLPCETKKDEDVPSSPARWPITDDNIPTHESMEIESVYVEYRSPETSNAPQEGSSIHTMDANSANIENTGVEWIESSQESTLSSFNRQDGQDDLRLEPGSTGMYDGADDDTNTDTSQFHPESVEQPTRKIKKRKRASQDTIRTYRPAKKQKAPTSQFVENTAQLAEENGDIQDCITVLPRTYAYVPQPESVTQASQSRYPLNRSTKPRLGWHSKSSSASIESTNDRLQLKRKAPYELSQEGGTTGEFRGREDGATVSETDEDVQQNEDDAISAAEPGSSTRRLIHVEIETGQRRRATSLDWADSSVDDMTERQPLDSLHADDTHGEAVLVGATEDEVDAAGCTAARVDAEDAEASQQLLAEQEAAQARPRPFARPRSIIERLKGILADCKGVVFGSHERLEMYDTLAEVQAEVKRRTDGGGDR